jgi:uncharacterized membrane protein
MKKFLPLMVLLTLSVLFYWISARSYALQSSELESLDLFRLFRGISNVIALFVPLVLFVFYMLTSGLMFTLLDEKFDSQKIALAISLSFIPVIIKCLIYLMVLYGIDKGGSLLEMLYQKSPHGLNLAGYGAVNCCFLGWILWVFAVLTLKQ